MPVTREQIRYRARVRADQDKSQFPTDAQYDQIIDSCARIIYGDLIQAQWPATKTKETVTLTGAASYSFAADIDLHSVHSVILMQGSLPVGELKRFDESRLTNMLTNQGAYPLWYDLEVDPDPTTGGNKFLVFPPGATGYTVDVRYIKGFPGFTSDSQIWHGPPGSDELVVLMAASQGAKKEGETRDADALDREYQVLWDRLTQRASWLDGRNPPKIREVENVGQYDLFDYLARDPRY
jgi:hypothetical protein